MNNFTVKSKFKIKNALILKKKKEFSLFNNMQNSIIEERIQKIINELNTNFEQKLQTKEKQAYQKGFLEGQNQTEKKLTGQLNHTINILQTIGKSLKQEIQKIIVNEEQDILELIIKISEKVIKTEITTNQNIIIATLKESLKLIHDNINVKIHVNKNDLSLVQSFIESNSLKLDLPKETEIVPSSSITQGGCIIETSSGTINADISSQFDEIKRKLLL